MGALDEQPVLLGHVPARKVALVSPCTPSMKAVTSMLTMSPSSITVESGIPWQMISFSEVQQDFG